MKILVCSSTFEEVTHGPAKFTQLLLAMEKSYPELDIRLLSRGISEEVANKKYKIEGWYPRGIGIFWEYLDNYKYDTKISRISSKWKPDVIIFVDVILGYITSKRIDKKTMVLGLINDNEYIRNNLTKISFSKEWFIKWKSRILEQWSVRSVDKVITNSEFLSRELEEKYKTDPKKIIRLYKSIRIEQFVFKQRASIDLAKEIKVLFVKSDFKRGGLFELIKALKILQEYNFRLFICGPNQSQKIQIERKLSEIGNVSLEFEYRTSQDRIRQLLFTADIFCTPALREALGVANIEALSTGIPVVSSDAGGIPEVLDFGNNGWISEANNVHSLAETIDSCLKNENERITKTKKGRTFVENNFSHFKMYSELYNIFNES